VQRQPAGDNFPPLPANIIYNKKNISVQLLRHKIQRLLNPHAQPSQMYGRNVNACKQNPASSLLPFSLRKKHLKSPTRQHFSLPPPPPKPPFSLKILREKQRNRDTETERQREGVMKLVWSPETASKAYIDTVKSVRALKPATPFPGKMFFMLSKNRRY
jgi:hypothetical protein